MLPPADCSLTSQQFIGPTHPHPITRPIHNGGRRGGEERRQGIKLILPSYQLAHFSHKTLNNHKLTAIKWEGKKDRKIPRSVWNTQAILIWICSAVPLLAATEQMSPRATQPCWPHVPGQTRSLRSAEGPLCGRKGWVNTRKIIVNVPFKLHSGWEHGTKQSAV